MKKYKYLIIVFLMLVPVMFVNASYCYSSLETHVPSELDVNVSNVYTNFDRIDEEYIDFDFSVYDADDIYYSNGKLYYENNTCEYDLDLTVKYKSTTVDNFYSILYDVDKKFSTYVTNILDLDDYNTETITTNINTYLNSNNYEIEFRYKKTNKTTFETEIMFDVVTSDGILLYSNYPIKIKMDNIIYLNEVSEQIISNYIDNNYDFNCSYEVLKRDNSNVYYVLLNDETEFELIILPMGYDNKLLEFLEDKQFTNTFIDSFNNYASQHLFDGVYKIEFENYEILKITYMSYDSNYNYQNYSLRTKINKYNLTTKEIEIYNLFYNEVNELYKNSIINNKKLDFDKINNVYSIYDFLMRDKYIMYKDNIYVGFFDTSLARKLNIYLETINEDNIKDYLLNYFEMEEEEYTLSQIGNSNSYLIVLTDQYTSAVNTTDLKREYGDLIDLEFLSSTDVIKYLPSSYKVSVSNEYELAVAGYNISEDDIMFDFSRFTFMNNVFIDWVTSKARKLYYDNYHYIEVKVNYSVTGINNLYSIVKDVKEKYSKNFKKLSLLEDYVNNLNDELVTEGNKYGIVFEKRGGRENNYSKTLYYDIRSKDGILLYKNVVFYINMNTYLKMPNTTLSDIETYVSDNYDFGEKSYTVSLSEYSNNIYEIDLSDGVVKIFIVDYDESDLDEYAETLKFGDTFFEGLTSVDRVDGYDPITYFGFKFLNKDVIQVHMVNNSLTKNYDVNVVNLTNKEKNELNEFIKNFNSNIEYNSLNKKIGEVISEINSKNDKFKIVIFMSSSVAPPNISYYVLMNNEVIVKKIDGNANNIIELHLDTFNETNINAYLLEQYNLTVNEDYTISMNDEIYEVELLDKNNIIYDRNIKVINISNEELLINQLPKEYDVNVSKYFEADIVKQYIDYDFSDYDFIEKVYIAGKNMYVRTTSNDFYNFEVKVNYKDVKIENLKEIKKEISNKYSHITRDLEEYESYNFSDVVININQELEDKKLRITIEDGSEDLFSSSITYYVETLDGILVGELTISNELNPKVLVDQINLTNVKSFVDDNYSFNGLNYTVSQEASEFNNNYFYYKVVIDTYESPFWLSVITNNGENTCNEFFNSLTIYDTAADLDYEGIIGDKYVYIMNNQLKIVPYGEYSSRGTFFNKYDIQYKTLSIPLKAELYDFIDNFDFDREYDSFMYDSVDEYINSLSIKYKIKFYNMYPSDNKILGYYTIYNENNEILYFRIGSIKAKDVQIKLNDPNIVSIKQYLLNNNDQIRHAESENSEVYYKNNNYYIKFKNNVPAKIIVMSDLDYNKKINSLPNIYDGLFTEKFLSQNKHIDFTPYIDYNFDGLDIAVKYEDSSFYLVNKNDDSHIKEISVRYVNYTNYDNLIKDLNSIIPSSFDNYADYSEYLYELNNTNNVSTSVSNVLKKYNLKIDRNGLRYNINNFETYSSISFGIVDIDGNAIYSFTKSFLIVLDAYTYEIENYTNKYNALKYYIEKNYDFGNLKWYLYDNVNSLDYSFRLSFNNDGNVYYIYINNMYFELTNKMLSDISSFKVYASYFPFELNYKDYKIISNGPNKIEVYDKDGYYINTFNNEFLVDNYFERENYVKSLKDNNKFSNNTLFINYNTYKTTLNKLLNTLNKNNITVEFEEQTKDYLNTSGVLYIKVSNIYAYKLNVTFVNSIDLKTNYTNVNDIKAKISSSYKLNNISVVKENNNYYLIDGTKKSIINITTFTDINKNDIPDTEETFEVKIKNKEKELYIGESLLLDYSYSPSNMQPSISSNNNNVSINNKTINAVKEGTSTVKVSLTNKIYDSIMLVVKNIMNDFSENVIEFVSSTVIKTKNFTNDLNKILSGIKLAYKLYDLNGKLVNRTNIVTGDSLAILKNNKELYRYTLVLPGDVNCDGEITPLDYVSVKNHIMGDSAITVDYKKEAADVNDDKDITPLDYVTIKNYIMGKGV